MTKFCFIIGCVLIYISGARAGDAVTMVAASFFLIGTLESK